MIRRLALASAALGLLAANGDNRTWFCGAWCRNGFHEDGVVSALDVVEGIAARGQGGGRGAAL